MSKEIIVRLTDNKTQIITKLSDNKAQINTQLIGGARGPQGEKGEKGDPGEVSQAQLDSTNVKVAKVEKELNDYKATMQQVNVNQEAKQKATGYGIVSLPKNSANGQVSVAIGGQTWTNLIDGAEVAPDDSRTFDSIDGHIYFDLYNGVIIAGDGTEKTVINAGDESANMAVFDLTQIYGQGNEPTAEQAQARLYYINDTKSTIGSARISSADDTGEVKDKAYVTAVKDDKIVNLRSLPNGTKDEIRVSEGKAIINTKKHILQTSDINHLFLEQEVDAVRILLPTDCKDVVDGIQSVIYGDKKFIPYTSRLDVSNVGAYSLIKTLVHNYLFLTVAKGTYATLAEAQSDLAGTELIYQLETPEVYPVQVSGNIVSYPSGTVRFEPAQPDAGIYNNGITILHQGLDIDFIEKLSKIDYETGVETELDASKAVIAEDKKSFTHPDLIDGDMIFFTYFYSNETVVGEMVVEYYDSRYVVKDKTTGLYYKWYIEIDNGVPAIKLLEV